MFITPEQTTGNIIKMKTTNPLHYAGDIGNPPRESGEKASFSDTLMKAIGDVNNLLQDTDDIAQKMIYEPESVDIHTAMITAQKAEIALNFTKAIRDEAIRSYRELMNLR